MTQVAPRLLFVFTNDFQVSQSPPYTYTAMAVDSEATLSAVLDTDTREAVHIDAADVAGFAGAVHGNGALQFSVNEDTSASRLPGEYATMSGATIQSFEVEPLSWGSDGAGNLNFRIALRVYGQ